MINHYVMFRLKGAPEEVAGAAREFKMAVEALPGIVPGLLSASVEQNCNPSESWSLILTATVDSMESLKTYANHPDHLAAVNRLKPFIADRAAVDVEL